MISCLKVDQILSKGAVDLVMFFFSFLIFFFFFFVGNCEVLACWRIYYVSLSLKLLEFIFKKLKYDIFWLFYVFLTAIWLLHGQISGKQLEMDFFW